MNPSLKVFVASILLLTCRTIVAQNSTQCAPVEVPVLAGANMFTPEQEQQLGELFAEQFDRTYGVIDDDNVTNHMQQIVDRLLATLAPISLRVQVFLTNEPVVNATSVPGRIYVTRKLIAFTANEDELAGVLAHELGHIVTRQAAIEFTDRFKQVLGITEIKDRDDLFNRYQEMIESLTRGTRKLRVKENQEQRDQLLADRTAMLMLARAGYDLSAYIASFDRVAETKGKTGSWFTELVGSTNPDQKRLRELTREKQSTVDTCAAPHPADPGFKQWQAQVISYSGSGHKERLHGVIARNTLAPSLRGDIHQLRFSPDGKYILAQDYSSIWVLSRQPLQSLFRIDAPAALPAHFTPDSAAVVFNDETDRVERWTIADQQQAGVYQVVTQKDCHSHDLSPDGKWIACIYDHAESGTPTYGVAVLSVETGEVKLDKPKLFQPSRFGIASYLNTMSQAQESLKTGFSPDGKYFVVSAPDGPSGFEVPTFAPINMPHELKSLLRSSFVFLDGGRVAAYNIADPKNSAILTFPGGDVQQRLSLGDRLTAVTKGNFIIESNRQGGLRLLDLSKNSFFLTTTNDGLDVYNDVFINDRPNGDVGVYDISSTKGLAAASLPLGPLSSVYAFAVSDDESWLAVSERTRGAVWNLKTGQRALFVRGFNGGYFDQEDALWADVDSFKGQPRSIVKMTAAPPATSVELMLDKETIKSLEYRQLGDYSAVFHLGEKGKGVALEMRKTVGNKSLWRHDFKDGTNFFAIPVAYVGNDKVALLYDPESARRQSKLDPALRDALPRGEKEARTTGIVEILDLNTGGTITSLPVMTSLNPVSFFGFFFWRPQVEVAGDRLLISENNRIAAYSLKEKKEVAAIFGNSPVASGAQNLLASRNDRWHVILRDLNTLQKKDEFGFASPVATIHFSRDGTKLYVLTQDQTFFVLSTGATPPAPAKTAMQ